MRPLRAATTAGAAAEVSSVKSAHRVMLVLEYLAEVGQAPFATIVRELNLPNSSAHHSAEDFQTAAAWIATGPPEAAELITREIRPDEADAAFDALAHGDDTPGKVLVRMDQSRSTTRED